MKTATTIVLIACVLGAFLQGYWVYMAVADMRDPTVTNEIAVGRFVPALVYLVQQLGLVLFFAVLRKNQK
jgi:hypothetical protein